MTMWRTKDGRTLELQQMEPSHIVNAMHMIQRAHARQLLRTSLCALRYALTAPDGASLAAENAADECMGIAYDAGRCFADAEREYAIVKEMVVECRRRGIPFIRDVWTEAV